jgi:hypothetical protein
MSPPEQAKMHLRSTVMLGAVITAFIAALFLASLPVSSSTAHNSTHVDCGSVVFNFKRETFGASKDSCPTAMGKRSSLVLGFGVVGLMLGFLDSMLAFAATRRRGTDFASSIGDETVPTDDLERLFRLYEDGELAEPAFAAHRAGVLLRAQFPPCYREM